MIQVEEWNTVKELVYAKGKSGAGWSNEKLPGGKVEGGTTNICELEEWSMVEQLVYAKWKNGTGWKS